VIKQILWFLFGYNNSVFDNRFIIHIAGAYCVSHITSLFIKKCYYIILVCFLIGVFKEILDHWYFGCGSNEVKHLTDILSWTLGGVGYYLIVVAKRKKYNYT
jgi:hypothetical protein